jgi:serine protease Do
VAVKELQKHPDEACKISEVDLDGPPAQAGIKEGDVVRSINGRPCTGKTFYHDINLAMMEKKGSGDVHIEILRKNNPMTFDLRYPNPDAGVAELRLKSAASASDHAASAQPAAAASQPSPPSGVRFGFQVRAVTEADVAPFGLAKARGIVVVDVMKDGLADKMGFLPGDVILEVNNSEIGDVDLFVQFARSGAIKSFRVWRKGQSMELVVPQSL